MTETSQDLVQNIFRYLKQKKHTLCVAESCTGGMISHYLTNSAGSSDFFVGGVVSYMNSAKTRALGISEQLLKSKGAVHQDTAKFMAVGVKSLLKGDWALSITGYMDLGEEPGRIFTGVLGPEIQDVSTKVVEGSTRVDLKYQSLIFSLNFLLSKLSS